MTEITPANKKTIIVSTLKDHKAAKVVAYNIKKLTDIADYMVIATANSTTHAKALAEKIREILATNHLKIIGIEGEDTREWVLVDCGDIIVHIMLESVRKFYDLEKLWGVTKIKTKRIED